MTNRIKILDRIYYDGYYIQKELIDGSPFQCKDIEIESAYTINGDPIGTPEMAVKICDEMGIIPEKKNDSVNICSIGFCEREQKWYFWSHRGISSYGIGDVVKKDNFGYIPDNVDELYDNRSWSKSNIQKDYENSRLIIRHDMVSYPNENSLTGDLGEPEPAEPDYEYVYTGKGEWVVSTLDEAKIAACNGADSLV